MGSVIGKGGYTIKSAPHARRVSLAPRRSKRLTRYSRLYAGIQAMSGASVQVAKEAAGSSARTVTISGAPACVAAAQAMVAQAIAQAQQPRGGSRPGAPSAAAGPRVELRLPCPADRIGWVIGPSGQTVKALRVLTGAQLDVLEEVTETGGRRGVIVLSGTAEAVDEAKTAVGGLIGAAHAAASKAYAAQLTEAAEARRKWDEEQARAQQAPPAAAEGAAAEGEAQPDASAQAAAAAAAAAAEWKEMTAKHPDGTTLRYWRHAATGMCRW